MDGRVNFQRITGILPLLMIPNRNIGGIYSVDWPLFLNKMNRYEDQAHVDRVFAGMIITYHYSDSECDKPPSERELCCSGFNQNTDDAIAHMCHFRRQVEFCFGGRIWPIVIGIETDHEAIIVHGTDFKRTVKVTDLLNEDIDGIFFADKLARMLQDILPGFPKKVCWDLVPLLVGNIRHVRKIRIEGIHRNPPKHKEVGVGVGVGFEWFPEGLLFAIGPCDPMLARPIVKAVGIVCNNMRSKRVPENGVLLISAPYYRDVDLNCAIAEACGLGQLAQSAIADSEFAHMVDILKPLVVATDMRNRRIHRIENYPNYLSAT
jgi:hypothetical protein